MSHQVNIRKFHVLPIQYIYVLYTDLTTKQSLFTYTILTDWFLKPRWELLTAWYELNSYI